MDDAAALWARVTQTDAWMVSGGGLLVSGLLWVMLRVVLSPQKRKDLRFPLLLLLTNGVLSLVHAQAGAAEGKLRALAEISLLLALARLGFVLVADVVIERRSQRPIPAIFRDIIQALVYAAVVFVGLRNAGVEPGSLLTTSALLTAVIGLALQETLGNLVAGLAIQAQRPFNVGDWIQFDNDPKHIGEVMEINWRATKILTEDKVEMVVPNGPLAKSAITNYSRPDASMRRTVAFSLPLSAQPRRVREAALRALSHVEHVVTNPAPVVTMNAWKDRDKDVEYFLQFFVTRFELRDRVESVVRERLWYSLERAGLIANAPMSDLEVRNVQKRVQGIDFLKTLPQEQLDVLTRLIQRRTYIPGEHIITEGEEGDEFFILNRGEVRIEVKGTEVARLKGGAFFGEMSLLTGERRSATVVAVDEVQLYVVGHQAFDDVLRGNPGVVELMSNALTARQMELVRARAEHEAAAAASMAEQSSQLLARIKNFFSLR